MSGYILSGGLRNLRTLKGAATGLSGGGRTISQ